MALSKEEKNKNIRQQEDIDKINYRPDIEWFKERMYRVAEGERPKDNLYTPSKEDIDPDKLLQNYRDLTKKATKLDEVIDELSIALTIPIDVEKQPTVSEAVAKLDASSKGEFLSYTLYRDLLNQIEAGRNNVDLNFILNNQTYDVYANSNLVYNQYIEGAKTYTAVPPIERIISSEGGVPAGERLTNTILNNISSWNEHEFLTRQIVQFAQGWLGATPDPSYIPWTFKEDVRRKLTEYTDIDKLLMQYTGMVTDIGGIVETFPATPLDLATDLWDSLAGKRDSDNNFFNRINVIFSMNYGADLICCFVAWSGGLDKKTLYALRLILQLMSNGLSSDWANLYNAFLSIINSLFRNIVCGQLIAAVDQIFQSITDPIKKWLNSNDEKWQKLFMCTPIDEFINIYIVGGLEALEKWLTSIIMDFWKRIQIDKYLEEGKVEIFGRKKWLADLARLLDLIIAAVGKSALCGQEGSPTGEEIKRFMEAYNVGPLFSYEYLDEEDPNEYNSFVREEIIIEKTTDPTTGEETIQEKTVARFDTGTRTADLSEGTVNIDKCLKKVAEDDVFSVQEWMDGIRSRSQEES